MTLVTRMRQVLLWGWSFFTSSLAVVIASVASVCQSASAFAASVVPVLEQPLGRLRPQMLKQAQVLSSIWATATAIKVKDSKLRPHSIVNRNNSGMVRC